jgi:pimeloyl-ACP methyl ester carboxylesterase
MTLAHDRHGAGRPLVLLHGWPGDRTDYGSVVPLLASDFDVVVPDLRGFGASAFEAPTTGGYGTDDHVRDLVALIVGLDLERPVLAGYDLGSVLAQAVARRRPDLVSALVLSPPLPGVGQRVLPKDLMEVWYVQFHRLDLVEQLLDGRPDAVRAYLRHFWSHWSGPDFVMTDDRLEHLASVYGAPGAFTASVSFYRAAPTASTERIAVPTTVLWPSHDPLFPRGWSERVGEIFTDARVVPLDGVGHFTPVEAPAAYAAAIAEHR